MYNLPIFNHFNKYLCIINFKHHKILLKIYNQHLVDLINLLLNFKIIMVNFNQNILYMNY